MSKRKIRVTPRILREKLVWLSYLTAASYTPSMSVRFLILAFV